MWKGQQGMHMELKPCGECNVTITHIHEVHGKRVKTRLHYKRTKACVWVQFFPLTEEMVKASDNQAYNLERAYINKYVKRKKRQERKQILTTKDLQRQTKYYKDNSPYHVYWHPIKSTQKNYLKLRKYGLPKFDKSMKTST